MGKSMIEIETLDHVQILAPLGSEAAIRAFYGQLLGLTEVEKPPELRGRGGVWFRIGAGPVLLHLSVEADPPPAGRRHFAFRVADVAAARAHLEAQGVPTGDSPVVAGMPRFFGWDPFGNQIEFMRYTTPLTPQPPSLRGKGESDSPFHIGEGSGVSAEGPIMPIRYTVQGKQIDTLKIGQAKTLRRQMTPEEAELWQHLRGNQLGKYHFRRQQVIAGFIVDFYCHQAALVVEVNGSIHSRQLEYDQELDTILSAGGFRVLRISNTAITQDLPTALNDILMACRGALAPLPSFLGGQGELDEVVLPCVREEAGRLAAQANSAVPEEEKATGIPPFLTSTGEYREFANSPFPRKEGGWGVRENSAHP